MAELGSATERDSMECKITTWLGNRILLTGLFKPPYLVVGMQTCKQLNCKEVLYNLDDECTAKMEEAKKKSVWPGWEKNVHQRKMNLALKDE